MKKAKPKILVLMGLPGAGKGTQAKLLQRKFDISHLSTGDMLRAKSQENDDLGRRIKHINATFAPMPDEIVIEMIRERISRPDCLSGFILDGFPRTLSQAEALDNMLGLQNLGIDKVILFDIGDEAIAERLSGRLNCPECKASYHVSHAPPAMNDFCDYCKSPLFVRDDDTEEKIKIRLNVFKESMKQLIPYYKRQGILETIDGMAPMDDVTAAIVKILSS